MRRVRWPVRQVGRPSFANASDFGRELLQIGLELIEPLI
jgi:hypothetical protein